MGLNKLLTDYLDFTQEFCDAPQVFHQAVLYSVVATIVGRKRHFVFGDMNIYPNLWIVLLAPSSIFRKSTSISIGMRLLSEIKPEGIYPSEFSHEKILEILKNQPTGIFIFYEFLSLLGLLSRDYMAGTKALLTELFDAPISYARKTKGNEILIENSAINIVSATTIDWVKSQIKESDLLGGFLPRFLFVLSYTKANTIILPQKADNDKRYKILSSLYLINKLNGFEELELDTTAKKLYIEWCKKLEAEVNISNRKENVLIVRSGIYLIKLAIISQIMIDCQSKYISSDAMSESIQFISYINKSISSNMMDDLTFGKNEDKIRKVYKIIKQFPDGVSKSKLLTHSHLLSTELNVVLHTLLEQETISSMQMRTDGADKPVTIYKLKND